MALRGNLEVKLLTRARKHKEETHHNKFQVKLKLEGVLLLFNLFPTLCFICTEHFTILNYFTIGMLCFICRAFYDLNYTKIVSRFEKLCVLKKVKMTEQVRMRESTLQ